MMDASLYGTRLYINIDNLKQNINFFKRNFPNSKIMAVVKANAYGHGDIEMGIKLKALGINCFAVADFEEGIRLRGVLQKSQIMVMNPGINNLGAIIKHKLQPVIYSNFMLEELLEFSKKYEGTIYIHIKLNTGMNRWGLNNNEAALAIKKVLNHNNIRIISIYSHLASSAMKKHDKFSMQQIESLHRFKKEIENTHKLNTHIFNSEGCLRFFKKQSFNQFVRLGISLYGGIINNNIMPISELKCTVSQIRTILPGEYVGYNLEYKAKKTTKIGVVSIGYADGLQRNWGNGMLKFYYKGELSPTVGNISMDSCVIDVSKCEDIKEGDDVLYFGIKRPIWKLAKELNTVPYEIISSLSRRIKRIYVSNNRSL